MISLPSFLTELRTLTSKSCPPYLVSEKLKDLSSSVWLKESELAQTLFAFLARAHHFPFPQPSFELRENGALLMLKKALFSWGPLPYPSDHAEMGWLLAELGEMETARKMASFQKAISNHLGMPIVSLLAQERERNIARHADLQRCFFEKTGEGEDILFNKTYYDPYLHLAIFRQSFFTAYGIGTGCKSGLGGFCSQDCGFITFGPQLFPLGQCDGFGISSKPLEHFFEERTSGFSMSFLSKVSAALKSTHTLFDRSDSGESSVWIRSKINYDFQSMVCDLAFEGLFDRRKHCFVLFAKGESAIVGKCHKLRPQTLDRYQGPPQALSLFGLDTSFIFDSFSEGAKMEVIPLASNENFWGADFLIAFELDSPSLAFSIECQQ